MGWICTCARAHPSSISRKRLGGLRPIFFCVTRDPLDKCFTHVWDGVHLHVRTCTPLFPDLANGWADCVQTWCVASDPLDERLTQVRCGVHLHVRMCTPPSHDGASSPARPSPIKASYWLYMMPCYLVSLVEFQIFTINEGYFIWRHESDFRLKTKALHIFLKLHPGISYTFWKAGQFFIFSFYIILSIFSTL